MIRRSLSLLALVLLGATGCAPSDEVDEQGVASEDALVSAPTGRFEIRSKPSTGSYVAALTLGADKTFDMDYVRRTTKSEPWAFNPWISVPVTRDEPISLRGTYVTYDDHGATMIAFEPTDGIPRGEHYIFGLATTSSGLKLTTADRQTFELSASSAAPPAADKRVIRCEGIQVNAVITFEDAARRRGTIAFTRKENAGPTAPPETSATVVYKYRTGVDDYMAYQGRDAAQNGYEFALRESDLKKTSGSISNVGLGYSAYAHFGGTYQNSLTCQIATE